MPRDLQQAPTTNTNTNTNTNTPPAEIIPSLYAADHAQLLQQAQAVYAAGAQNLHIDIMDGVFVPAIGLSIGAIRSLRAHLPAIGLHAHLMTVNPQQHLPALIAAGATCITIHAEATAHTEATLTSIRTAGLQAGVALNPGTPLNALDSLLHVVDSVLIMTANPGHPGALFVDAMLSKVEAARNKFTGAVIIVDGHINRDNIQRVQAHGAHHIVCGRALFDGDPGARLHALRHLLQQAL